MTGPRRVVVTGLGIVSPIGNDVATYWQCLSDGTVGIEPFTMVDPKDFHFSLAAAVKGFDPTTLMDARLVQQTDKFAQFAIAAAQQALSDAGLIAGKSSLARCAVIAGTTIGGQDTQDEGFSSLYHHGRSRLPPTTVVKIMPSSAVSQIAILFGITGPSYTVSAACSSSNCAIGQAFSLVRSGAVDMAVTGGSDAPLSYGNMKAWDAMRLVSPETCRPFSLGRKGMILGEGGGILVLETAEAALDRGAHIYAEVVGYGTSTDATHLLQPSAEGAARSIVAAIADAGLTPSDVNLINAHGTGTQLNDACETMAIKMAFGERTKEIAVTSTKSMHGHALGAAGALESVATILSIHHSLVPPTMNFLATDPQCDLNVVANAASHRDIGVALSNSFAFGGINAVLAFRKWQH